MTQGSSGGGRVTLDGPDLRISPKMALALARDDIRAACDILRGVWDEGNGKDGWVSLEVSPLLADDAAATIEQVKERIRSGEIQVPTTL